MISRCLCDDEAFPFIVTDNSRAFASTTFGIRISARTKAHGDLFCDPSFTSGQSTLLSSPVRIVPSSFCSDPQATDFEWMIFGLNADRPFAEKIGLRFTDGDSVK